jgi:sterol desaturase/sphingolipid hydroxylase (fatty acid hydroxylase superfamily)
MAFWEIFASRRLLTTPKSSRWITNLSITFINSLLGRWLPPILPISFAALASDRSWGLLNQVQVPGWFTLLIGFLLLDLGIYLQHNVFHKVPILWRIHRVHHTDLDFDVTTGLRFHPIEIILSLIIKLGLIVVIGPPASAVLLFEIMLNAVSMFNHGNIRIPRNLDKYLRWFVVTPDMHRVHHSVIRKETDSNFGFNIPWWDRMFGTYRSQPEGGHRGMEIGLSEFRIPERLTITKLLLLPFQK